MKQKNKLLSFNTTIRNPERYTKFLKVVKKFHNSTYSERLLLDIERELIKHGVYEPINRSQAIKKKQNKEEILSDYEVDEILRDNPQKPKWIGRAKSHLDILRELAFLRVKEGKLIITSLGFELLDENIDFNDFWTKLLLKVQFGNPFRKTVDNKSNPFLFILHIIDSVNSIWRELGEKPVGISRIEFQYFVLPMINNDYNLIAQEIISYRKKFRKKALNKKVNNLFSANSWDQLDFLPEDDYLVEFISRRLNNKKRSKNIKETSAAYSDNVIRHLRYTGLISFRGNAKFIDISEGFEQTVREILKKFKLEWRVFDNEDDYVDFLLSDIKLEWKIKRENQENSLLNLIENNKINLSEASEELRYIGSKNNEEMRKTFLKGFKSEETKNWWVRGIKAPLKLEILLAILFVLKFDNIKVNPRFLIDDEGLPYHHAPAKESDIEINYNNEINLLVEATLLRDKVGQKNSETSAITRRAWEFKIKTKLITYAILVAPYVHMDTYLYFKSLLSNNIVNLGECYAFPLSIKKFLENFIDDPKTFREKVENNFENFKITTKLDELDKLIN